MDGFHTIADADDDVRPPQVPATVTIGDPAAPLTLAQLEALATGSATAAIHGDAMRAAAQSEASIARAVADRRTIYGVTTGYGPLADNQIDPARGAELQRKLVYHLATGVGAPLPPIEARAVMIARLAALSRGLSAVRPELLAWLRDGINRGLAPIIPEKGTVGASGDLTPLAHMALAFIGEGAFWRNGAPAPAAAVLADAGLAPIELRHKEGLALVNGTSAMAGIAALNGVRARRLLRISALLTVAYAEALGGHRGAWHPLTAVARPHPGQRRACALHWPLTEDAPRLIPHAPMPPVIAQAGDDGVAHAQALPQDAYSIRCAPQLLGAVDDMLLHHDGIVEIELSATTDNPLVFSDADAADADAANSDAPDSDAPNSDAIVHAGNFFGQHVSFASDSLFNAVTMIGVWSERQVARITDASLNRGLPPFLQGRATGLNSGFMGAQVTASALVAELRTRSAPASIQSVPTNANNQDVVTMGTIAARRARDAVTDVGRILAIQAMCVAQAVDLRTREDHRPFGAATRAVRDAVRGHVPFLGEDRPLSTEIETLADALIRGDVERDAGRRSTVLADGLNAF